MKRSTAAILIVIAALIGIAYEYERANIAANSFSLTGYVAFESPPIAPGCPQSGSGTDGLPCAPAYDFIILSATSTPINGTLPSMDGFPALDNADYAYISYAGYTGTLPGVGDKVSVTGTIDKNAAANPPYGFADTAKKFDILVDAKFNSTVQGLIETFKMEQ